MYCKGTKRTMLNLDTLGTNRRHYKSFFWACLRGNMLPFTPSFCYVPQFCLFVAECAVFPCLLCVLNFCCMLFSVWFPFLPWCMMTNHNFLLGYFANGWSLFFFCVLLLSLLSQDQAPLAKKTPVPTKASASSSGKASLVTALWHRIRGTNAMTVSTDFFSMGCYKVLESILCIVW